MLSFSRHLGGQQRAVAVRELGSTAPAARTVSVRQALQCSPRPVARWAARSVPPQLRVRRGPGPCAAIADMPLTSMEHAKKFKYGKDQFWINVSVREVSCGDEVVTITTNHPSNNLLLHWGVEGGAGYKGGWRLPALRPENTVQYKDRALQTRFKRTQEGIQTLVIELSGQEASDYINFVLKDEATSTWYDANGSNFQMALRSALRSFASIDDAESGVLLSLDEIPELPNSLCGVWAYIKWEYSGCPHRSQEDADREYKEAIKELTMCLQRGMALDQLWEVANGKVAYKQFKADFIDVLEPAPAPKAPAPKPAAKPAAKEAPKEAVKEADIPDDIIAIKAYIMWEQAGRQQGADFSAKARESIAEELRQGQSIEDIEKRLRAPAKQAAPAAAAPAAAPPAAKPQTDAPVVLGDGIDMPRKDPLSLIRKVVPSTPQLSEDKSLKKEKPLDFLVQQAAVDDTTRFRRVFGLSDGSELLAVVRKGEGDDAEATVQLTTDSPNRVVMHWGVGLLGKDRSWVLPPKDLWPSHSEHHDGGIAVDTLLDDCENDLCDTELLESRVPLQRATLTIPPSSNVANLQFVLRSEDGSMWYRDGAQNFVVPIPGLKSDEGEAAPAVSDPITMAIIDSERTNAWTLMHRFNRSADLLEETLSGKFEDQAHATAALYVWLRYSATRHLTWQRNYNTQPRILSGAQDRLTKACANAHKNLSGEAQEWARMMLSTVGRGGDGQKIRDEILNIMHRNHIKEVKGTWMEEWHQKLHNNTTPDDIPICEAYIAFLKSRGDVGQYWRVLSDAGITRARLEGFDRAIRCEPEYYGDKRDTLIGEFQNYLGILKAVHSGADLQNSAKNAGGSVPGSAKSHLGYVLASQGSNQVLPLIQSAVACRMELAPALAGNRELLYLDLALENVVRAAAERGTSALGMGAAAFCGPLLQNLVLTVGDNEELCYCLKAWQALPRNVQCGATPTKEEALKATAVVDRIRRGISDLSNRVVERISPISTAIGKSCGVESWAVDLFAEEVVRGGPAFAVSLVLSAVEPALRRSADLGSWQIVSPANVTGRVLVVDGLHDIQDVVYSEPTILVAQRVSGEEEIPEGSVAVLTPDAPDILSHVSVRARNMKVLFATCHEPGPLEEISQHDGKLLSFKVTAAGGVTWEPADESDLTQSGSGDVAAKTSLKIDVPDWSGNWVVKMSEYADGVVGAKSKNLAALRGQLPDWISLPSSVTLPFGCFEEALDAPENAEIKKRVLAAAKQVPDGPATALSACREAVMEMTIPKECRSALESAMKAEGIPVPESAERWALADKALLGVWASKFNDRAYFSMRKNGLNFMDLRMAVLVQRVVTARYAFVIHTRNPMNNDESEIYCELVKGLGESLVSGTVPGYALSFVAKHDDLENPRVIAFPSKSDGMFVRESLIFRSDSNGEDLAGYAGAGLYESVTMDPTELEKIDFSDDPIIRDEAFRKDLLTRICKTGAAIQQSMGSAQDIEGVVDPDGNITVVQTRPQ